MKKALSSSGLERSEYSRMQYSVLVPGGVRPEDVLVPSFWAHHSDTLKARDLIEVVAEDNSFEMTLRVFTTGIQYVKVRELSRHVWGEPASNTSPEQADEVEPFKLDEITVTWGGPAHKWRVLNGNNLVSKGHKTKEEAEARAKEYHAEINEVAA